MTAFGPERSFDNYKSNGRLKLKVDVTPLHQVWEASLEVKYTIRLFAYQSRAWNCRLAARPNKNKRISAAND